MNKSLLIALFSFISHFSFSQATNPGIPTFPTTNRIKFGYQTEAKGLIWITNQAPGTSQGYNYTPTTNLDYFFILNSATGILYNYRDGAWKQLGLNLSDASISGTLPVARGGTGAGEFTQGSIVFAGASGVYSQNNSGLFWDNTNRRLTVGSTTAGANLNVYTSSYGNNGLINAYNANNVIKLQMGALADDVGYIYTPTSTRLDLFSGATTTMTLSSDQNVGIGVSNPASRLHIKQSADAHSGGLKLERFSVTNTYSLNVDANNNLNLGYAATASGAPTNRLILDVNGNIGIGTNSPNSAAGYNTLSIAGSSGGQMTWQTGTTLIGYVYNTPSNFIIGSSSTKNLIFDAGAVERMRITNLGNINIGGDYSQTTHTLNVTGTGNFTTNTNKAIRIKDATHNTLSSNLGSALIFTRQTGLAETSSIFSWNDGGLAIAGREGLVFATGGGGLYPATVERMRVTSTGNVGIGIDNPTKKLQVSGNFDVDDGIFLNDASGGYIAMRQATSSANDFAGELVGKAFGNNPAFNLRGIQTTSDTKTNGVVQLQAANSNNSGAIDGADKAITFLNWLTEMVTVLGNGNTGIGTTTPQNRLDVEGAVAIGASYSGSAPAAPTNGLIVEGSVGIGTNNPTVGTALDINGNVRIRTLTNGTLAVDNTGVVKKEPTLKNISLGEGYADNIREFYYNNSYTVHPNDLGYDYGSLTQQNLLREASLIFVPTATQVSKLSYQKPLSLTSDFTYTRNTTATRVNSLGLVEVLANNEPRIDYITGDAALLIEPARTNLVLSSEVFTASTGTTITTNSDISPSGTQTADKLVENTSNSIHISSLVITLGGTVDGVDFAFSVFIKMSGRSRVQIFDNNQNTSGITNFDLLTGTIISGTGRIENYGDGWYRCTIFPKRDGLTTANIQIRLIESGTTTTYTGDGVSGVLLWGSQCEIGTYATSYIPTSGSTITRNADVVSRTNVADLIGQTEGTLFCEIDFTIKREIGTPVVGIIALNNNINNLQNVIWVGINRDVNNQIYCIVNNANVTQAAIFSSNLTSGTYKAAFAYKQNDFVLYVNGAQVATDNLGTVPTTSQVLLGSRQNSEATFYFADEIKQAHVYKTRLTNTQLAELTRL